MTDDLSISAKDFLLLVAGEVCPCGHEAAEHEPGRGEGFPLENFTEALGECLNEACECKGLLE